MKTTETWLDYADGPLACRGANGGRILRLKDVARVELGAQTYSQNFKIDGKPASGAGW